MIGVLVADLGILIGGIGITIGLIVSGIVFFAVGFVKLFSAVPVGILSCGVGLILIALGIAFTVAIVLICARLIPACVKGVVKLAHMPFDRKGNFA